MRRLCRFTAGFAAGCAACVLGLSGKALLAAMIAGALALAVVCSAKTRLRRLRPAALGLLLALTFCFGYRTLLLRPVERFCAQEQADISTAGLSLCASRQAAGASVPFCITRRIWRYRPVTEYSARRVFVRPILTI